MFHKQRLFAEKSLNWIAPSKAVAITWCGAAWDEITLENLNKGCKKCYMDPADFDEDMAKYDGVQDFSEIKFDPKWSKSVLGTVGGVNFEFWLH